MRLYFGERADKYLIVQPASIKINRLNHRHILSGAHIHHASLTHHHTHFINT